VGEEGAGKKIRLTLFFTLPISPATFFSSHSLHIRAIFV
jgi:hypothetical protein